MSVLPVKTMTLSGWGNTLPQRCDVVRPETYGMPIPASPAIARGMGRAYGDAAQSAPCTIDCTRLDRFLAFDTTTGILRVQGGVTLAELLRVSVPLGWIPAVMPGTRYVTVGGACASNIHGKNQYRDGSFGRHVLHLILRLADGNKLSCSRQQNAEAFYATLGGMGLTGIIEEVTLQLKPILSASLVRESRIVSTLTEAVTLFREHSTAEYMIAWLDAFSGKAVFEHAHHATAGVGEALARYSDAPPRLTVPSRTPRLVRPFVTRLYNRKRLSQFSRTWKQDIVPFHNFFFPLDAIGQWNRLYGKAGLLQHHSIIPDSPDVAMHLDQLLGIFKKHHVPIHLAVLKYYGAEDSSLLPFAEPGFGMALDMVNTADAQGAMTEANDYIAQLGGRVYLAKDATLTAAHYEHMYGANLPRWREAASQLDPAHHFSSALSERLHIRDKAA